MAQFTIKDIARKLGISPSTVSRALHDHPDISDETKKRVVELAAKHNYQPNQIAKSLQNSRTSTIGVVVPEIEHHFFSSAISGVEEVAYKAGYTIMVCQSQEQMVREAMNIRALVAHRVAGIVVSVSRDTTDFSHLEAAVRQGIPLVQFDRVIEELDTSKVVVDDFNGAYAGVHHLLEAGYTRIAHLAGREHVTIGRERFEGYRQALQDHGFPVDERLVIPGGFQEHDGEQGMKRLLELDSPPDAVFAVNDPVAIGAYRVLRERGLRIPRDVALLGFCNNPESALVEPPLSTVAQPAWQMGKAAAQLLFRQFEQKNFTPQTQVLRTRLIVRQST
ncbi:LacI family DNA-binding transcriptional regulator [Pseudodesulfovibrio senegalensis]|uniref:LacI family transcriptional regulator n=1 Tax=Pseudodesulfovibrio senegalensis TaxID=1721087 RepID=A0A6N6N655_9BACT|nr:LacI family DNA-binding transcriptional regulator [Pseudodesulfovibrio senegalensis]KAB1443221.1 LacI family transcriptional regulator [Pseudodesulfovibrio senegalensis]